MLAALAAINSRQLAGSAPGGAGGASGGGGSRSGGGGVGAGGVGSGMGAAGVAKSSRADVAGLAAAGGASGGGGAGGESSSAAAAGRVETRRPAGTCAGEVTEVHSHAEFEAVLRHGGGGAGGGGMLVVVDFTAKWCRPCQQIKV
jgi:hypothetical protein